jgi:hypothetical protein
MRTFVAVRSVFPKALGIVMNVSKCGSVEKMMPVLRVVRITWKIECYTCYKLHTVLCSE